MHVYWVEISWVLGVIYVLAEDRKSISFIRRLFGTFGIDDVPWDIGHGFSRDQHDSSHPGTSVKAGHAGGCLDLLPDGLSV